MLAIKFKSCSTLRQTKGYEENRLASVISGNTMFDKAYSLIIAA